MTEMKPEDRAFLKAFMAWKHRSKIYEPALDADLAPQQAYDQLMKERFGPALRDAGLKGSGGRFEFPSENYWAQLGFQKSAFSDSLALKFTVNLSVIERTAWAERAAAEPYLGNRPRPGTDYGWGEQIRIGQLTPSGEDLWWLLERGQDPQPVAEEVVTLLLNAAVPWLIERSRP